MQRYLAIMAEHKENSRIFHHFICESRISADIAQKIYNGSSQETEEFKDDCGFLILMCDQIIKTATELKAILPVYDYSTTDEVEIEE